MNNFKHFVPWPYYKKQRSNVKVCFSIFNFIMYGILIQKAYHWTQNYWCDPIVQRHFLLLSFCFATLANWLSDKSKILIWHACAWRDTKREKDSIHSRNINYIYTSNDSDNVRHVHVKSFCVVRSSRRL